jgi:hypothetical protein
MNGEHSAVKEWAVFLSNCFVLVLRVDVLKNLFGVEGISVEVIAFYPQSGRKVVLVVGDVDVVFTEIFFSLLHGVLSADLHKAPLVALTLENLLFGKLANTGH